MILSTHQFLFETLPPSMPVRKSHPDIPEDIYRCIFDHIIQPRQIILCNSAQCFLIYQSTEPHRTTYRHQLSQLTLVCRFFASVFMPILLSSAHIPIRPPPPLRHITEWFADRSQKKPLGGFARSLVQGDKHARARIRYVKECRLIMLPTRYYEIKMYGEYLVQVMLKLPCTIESLFLWRSPINDQFFPALVSLKNLTSLTLSNVIISFPLELPHNPTPSLVSLSMSDITIIDPFSPEPAMDPLVAFLCSDSMRILHTDNSTFLDAFVRLSPKIYLEELEFDKLQPGFIPSFLYHLSRMPFLKTLLIDSLHLQHRVASIPLDDSLPWIQTSIRTLHTFAYVYFRFATSLRNAFPHLDELFLRFPGMADGQDMESDNFVEYISALAEVRLVQLLPITTLSLSFGSNISHCQWVFNLALQAQTITSLLLPTFPALKCVTFAPDCDKGWMWRLQSEDDHASVPIWKPSAGEITQDRILNTLNKKPEWRPHSAMDFDRTLAGLLRC